MNSQTHGEKIYAEESPDAVSWYRPHLEKSRALIQQVTHDRSASIIDVGGGESTLVDDLLAAGYENVTVLDISQTAIGANKKRPTVPHTYARSLEPYAAAVTQLWVHSDRRAPRNAAALRSSVTMPSLCTASLARTSAY